LKFLFFGLGNIGKEYAGTRHNIGFDIVHAFATKHQGVFLQDKHAFVADVKFKGKTVKCICPTTFMNLSGKAFKYWLDKEKAPLEQTITILDDLSLPIDKIRIRKTGTHAGHNGLKDIQATINTDAYPKLRFGIGNHFAPGQQANFVLSKWNAAELPTINNKLNASVNALETFVLEGIDNTMTKFNNISYTS
jgi:peptidyl-tRNA hydrolase, PTH1 family